MRALDDIIVVDLTRHFFGSLSAAFLGDFGARVVRVDLLPTAPAANEGSWNCEADLIHRNKQSIAINPKDTGGVKILRELLARADVVVTDRDRAELEALGVDYAAAAKLRPDVIYGRISGFGPIGPDRDLPVIDELAAARTGMMPILPQPDQPPVYTGSGQMHAAVMLTFGVVTALFHRLTSGEGQEVDVSLFGANMYGACLDIQAILAMGVSDRFIQPTSRLDVANPILGATYPCSDGLWVALTMPDTDRWWGQFCDAVGLDPADSRFDTHDKRTKTNRLELIHELERRFKTRPGSEWRQVLMEKQLSGDVIERFDFPASDPQVSINRYIVELDHPSFGKVKSLGFPISLSDTPARLDSLAPCVGQHSAQVLSELLGYSEDNISALTTTGVVA